MLLEPLPPKGVSKTPEAMHLGTMFSDHADVPVESVPAIAPNHSLSLSFPMVNGLAVKCPLYSVGWLLLEPLSLHDFEALQYHDLLTRHYRVISAGPTGFLTYGNKDKGRRSRG